MGRLRRGLGAGPGGGRALRAGGGRRGLWFGARASARGGGVVSRLIRGLYGFHKSNTGRHQALLEEGRLARGEVAPGLDLEHLELVDEHTGSIDFHDALAGLGMGDATEKD